VGATAHGLAAEVVRVVSVDADAVRAFLTVCARTAGASQRLDAAVASTAELLRAAAAEARQDPAAVHAAARWLVERLAVTLQGALVLAGSPAPVCEAFLASRLDPSGVRGLTTLPLGRRQAALVVDRALGDV
jgi:putative acyl-CoA dehydrogenase